MRSVTRAPELQLQLAHEGDQGRLLLRRQLHAQHEVEKLHRILQRQEAPVVQVWRGVLDPAQGEGLDGALGVDPLIVDPARLVEAHDPQRPFPKNTSWPRRSSSVALAGSRVPRTVNFGVGGKSNMFCIWAIMATWLARSGRLTPFLAAVTWSPSK